MTFGANNITRVGLGNFLGLPDIHITINHHDTINQQKDEKVYKKNHHDITCHHCSHQSPSPGLGLQTCCLATFQAMFLPGRDIARHPHLTNHQSLITKEHQRTPLILFLGLGLQTCCLATFLAMFLPGRKRKFLGREGYFREAEQVRIEWRKI